MDTPPATYRQLKSYLRTRMQAENFTDTLLAILDLPARKAVNPLISFFCDKDALLRWRSVSALGAGVARLADENRDQLEKDFIEATQRSRQTLSTYILNNNCSTYPFPHTVYSSC